MGVRVGAGVRVLRERLVPVLDGVEDGRLALLVLPVEVDLDGVRLDEDVDDPSRGLETALTR